MARPLVVLPWSVSLNDHRISEASNRSSYDMGVLRGIGRIRRGPQLAIIIHPALPRRTPATTTAFRY